MYKLKITKQMKKRPVMNQSPRIRNRALRVKVRRKNTVERVHEYVIPLIRMQFYGQSNKETVSLRIYVFYLFISYVFVSKIKSKLFLTLHYRSYYFMNKDF